MYTQHDTITQKYHMMISANIQWLQQQPPRTYIKTIKNIQSFQLKSVLGHDAAL